mgnify:FL=1|jgi:HAD superfamily hydrolase (TIGR01459 family)|tara:strand:- start:740 stop:1558 length:819 start_codon:yes stop_codon:yes gene_type:complete
MAQDINKLGFKSIVENYDLFFIDIWGVIHNGINLHKDAVEVLKNLFELNKEFILLTNAPRPNRNVIDFLLRMGLDKKYTSKVYTSGQAALNYLINNYKNKTFYHIGPPRDFGLFQDFESMKTKNIDNAEYFLCTGLFDEYNNDLNYYKKLLETKTKKIMICTNPDLIVDRGQVREYCAGSVAKSFYEIGGKVEYFGKPYPQVYNQSAEIKNKRTLCIGDNLNTDIRGANIQSFDSLLVSSGIHKTEIETINFDKLLKKYDVKVNFIQSNLKW